MRLTGQSHLFAVCNLPLMHVLQDRYSTLRLKTHFGKFFLVLACLPGKTPQALKIAPLLES
jgi:hypothetical protein